jgi:hypothetical protein
MKIKNWLLILVIGFLSIACSEEEEKQSIILLSEDDEILKIAFETKQSDLQVKGSGVVTRLLPDDLVGDKHQKFILALMSSQTLLVSHNIDLAARIDALQVGDAIDFYGEYEWNIEGGVIHWTHDDPNGVHVNGWLIHEGVTYH